MQFTDSPRLESRTMQLLNVMLRKGQLASHPMTRAEDLVTMVQFVTTTRALEGEDSSVKCPPRQSGTRGE